MNKGERIAIGLLAFAPLIGAVAETYLENAGYFGINFLAEWFYVIVIGIVWLVLIGFIAHTWTSAKVPATKRWLWTAVLVLGNIFSFPVYWYHYVYINEVMSVDDSST